MSDLAKIAILIVGLAIWIGAGPSSVVAHSELIAADPEFGGRFSQPNQEIILTFDEPLEPGSTFTVTDSQFAQMTGSVSIEPTERLTLVGRDWGFPAAGVYTVQWVSVNQDGHMLTGSFGIEVTPEGVSDRSEIDLDLGEPEMMELTTLAEGTYNAVNLPGWFAWMMVIIALGSAFAVWNMSRSK